ncbi:hypothetical protein B0J18DRAFT_13642 [Chaetomium sp. MPI-SDFR-AT-0129]|nr:hypothetical protein B0J18DRAFT_13642 [Chaetomium sp. MPI-SDFR-AT-0129]
MSILKTPKQHQQYLKTKATKASKPTQRKAPARAPAVTSKAAPTVAAARPGSSTKDPDSRGGPEDATAKLKRSFDNLAADKRENSAVIVGGLPNPKGGKFGRLLDTHGGHSPRSLPPSPALSGIGSPSLAASGQTTQDKAKQQRFPLMHELAVQDLSRDGLLARWNEGTEEEFNTVLDKVASFDEELQTWVLRKNCWKDLDIFEYKYSSEDRRQKAISNAIKWFDRNRVSASDPLWQKLLPKRDRGKGICLSNLQVTLAKGPVVTAPKQRAETASASGGDSEKDESGVPVAKGKGGEAMSRSNSQTSTGKKKLSASEAQAKRLLSTTKKKALPAPGSKAASKTSAPKPTAKAAPAKGGRVLSKEFVSDSSSSDDEVPLSTSMGKSKAAGVSAPKPPQRVENPKPAEKPKREVKEVTAAKPKPTPAARIPPRERKTEKDKDTIHDQVIAKPIRPQPKRPRDAEDDDSSSSGTPLSKRVKPPAKPLPASVNSAKARTASDASQNRGVSAAKAKNTSPTKSSPLALSPPTNASEVEQDRVARPRERDRERERRREVAVRSSSSTTDSSSIGLGIARKRPPVESLSGSKPKRQRPSQETVELAAKFRQFYGRYLQLHRDVASHDNPDPDQVTDLLDMHQQLSRMKTEIYAAVEV